MSSPKAPKSSSLDTLRAAVNAGALAGLFLGVYDATVAATRIDVSPAPGLFELAGCYAAVVLIYGVALALGFGLGAPLWGWIWRGRTAGEQLRILFGLGLAIGITFELYWGTKELLFWGLSALSPQRLAVAAGCIAIGLFAGWILARTWARAPRRVQLAASALALLAWPVGALFLISQQSAFERAGRGEINERNRDLPNVLLVVIDALRQDTVGAYGNDFIVTPRMDQLAEEGVLFENAYVQAPYTWTSFGSFLTGKYPRRHGLMKMLPGYVLPSNVTVPWHLKEARFRPDSPQHAAGFERLEPNDYVAATFMTGALTHGSRLDRGFDVYSEAMQGHDLVARDSLWSVFKSEVLAFLVMDKATQVTDYNKAASTAVEWLTEYGDRRFFAMVHLYSTHTPYKPPGRIRELYCDPEYEGRIDEFWAYDREAIERGQLKLTQADREQIANLYYGGATQADHQLGRILDVLEQQGVLDDTLVVVTADHGEDLGEGERWEHNFMYETNLRVPLIMRWPDHLPSGERVQAQVDSIDFLPTICDLLGLEVPTHAEGASQEEQDLALVDGTSVMPVVLTRGADLRDYTYAENGTYLSVSDGAHKLVLRRPDLDGANWDRLVVNPRDPEFFGGKPIRHQRFFDLAVDPEERVNLFETEHESATVQELRRELERWSARMPIRSAEIVPSDRDKETARALAALGYGDEFEPEEELEDDEDEPTEN